jgi:HD-like signal output (HDOD) protein
VVLRALQKKPKDRFASMKDFRDALELSSISGPAGNPLPPRRGLTPPIGIFAMPQTPMALQRSGLVTSMNDGSAETAADRVQDLITRLVKLVMDRLASARLELPPLPEVTDRCMDLLRQSNLGFADASRMIGQVPVLKSRVMRLANSAAFPSLMPATTLDSAIARLGTEGLYGALLEFAARDVLEGRHPRVKEAFRRIWKHALGAGMIASELTDLLGRESESTFAYLAGLLHDIGKPVVGGLVIDIEQQMIRADNRTWVGDAAWLGTVDATYLPVGAAIARKWKLAHPVCEAIESAVGYDQVARRSLGNILRFSDALAQRLGLTVGSSNPIHAEEICTEGRALLGVDDRMMRRLSHGLKERATVLAGIRGQ